MALAAIKNPAPQNTLGAHATPLLCMGFGVQQITLVLETE